MKKNKTDYDSETCGYILSEFWTQDLVYISHMLYQQCAKGNHAQLD